MKLISLRTLASIVGVSESTVERIVLQFGAKSLVRIPSSKYVRIDGGHSSFFSQLVAKAEKRGRRAEEVLSEIERASVEVARLPK